MRRKTMYRNLNLTSKILIITIAAVVIPLLILGALFYMNLSRYIYDKESRNVMERLNTLSSQITQVFAETENLSYILSNNNNVNYYVEGGYDNYPYMTDISRTFSNLILPCKYIQSVALFSNAYSGTSFRMGQTSVVDIEGTWFDACHNVNEHPVWAGTQRVSNQYTDVYVFSVYKLVTSLDKKNELGILRINIYEDYISNLFLEYAGGGPDVLYLMRPDGEILSSTDNKRVGTTLVHENIQRALSTEEEGHFLLDFEGGRFLFTFTTLSGYDFKLVSFVPYKTLMQDTTIYRYYAFALVLTCVLTGIGLSYGIARNLTRPVKALCSTMEQVGEGDFQIRLYSDRNDEIGQLTRSFDSMVRNINDLFQKVGNLEFKNKEAELIALQAKINPHFLHNTLNSINWLIYMEENEKASRQVQALSNIFRHSLNEGRNITTLKEELNQISDYMIIMQERFPDKFEYKRCIPEELADCLMPSLMLQPLVENSIYHGLEGRTEKGIITIRASRNQNDLLLIVEDNGLGCDADRINRQILDGSSTCSYALRNIQERLLLCFGSPYGLRLYSEPGQGTRVELLFPICREEASLLCRS